MCKKKPLSNEQLNSINKPVLKNHTDKLEKYHFIPTIDVIEEIRANGGIQLM